MSQRKVSIIQPKDVVPCSTGTTVYPKRRVAGYARVSTESEEQLSSYEAQFDFYTNHIKSTPQWEFAGVYTDEGISATNTKKRDGFNRMIADALAGKIDLILTKSISRFARNTVDSLVTVRKLKDKGVEVYFEKENIHTLDAKGEVLITIMSSLAQEESRSISENVIWGKRKSMEDGKISLPYQHFLGYEKGADGLPQIVESQARVVRRIYRMYLEGKTIRSMAGILTGEGIPTPRGKKNWSVSTLVSILRNEKYMGDALLQKTYTADFLSKTVRKNLGERPQYYIENSHPAIIEKETWDLVQSEMKKRQPSRRQLNNNSPFSAKIICGRCGGYYGSKVWHSSGKYRNRLWRCNRKYENESICDTPHIREEVLKSAFVQAFSQILGDKERYMAQAEALLPRLADTSDLEKKRKKAEEHRDAMLACMHRHMAENAHQGQDQAQYQRRFQEMEEAYKEADKQVEAWKNEILEQKARKGKLSHFLGILRQREDPLVEFDEGLWHAIVDSVRVSSDNTLTFLFKDGTEIPVTLPGSE